MTTAGKVRALVVNGRCNASAFLVEQSEQAGSDDGVMLMRRDAEGRTIISYANLTPEAALMLAELARDEAVRWERED